MYTFYMETFIHRDQNFRIFVLLRNSVFHEVNFVQCPESSVEKEINLGRETS